MRNLLTLLLPGKPDSDKLAEGQQRELEEIQSTGREIRQANNASLGEAHRHIIRGGEILAQAICEARGLDPTLLDHDARHALRGQLGVMMLLAGEVSDLPGGQQIARALEEAVHRATIILDRERDEHGRAPGNGTRG